MADELNIQIKFTIDTKYGPYSDALYISKSDFDTDVITQEQIDAMKQSRADNWVYLIDNPPAPPVISEKTPEELQRELTELQARESVIESLLGV